MRPRASLPYPQAGDNGALETLTRAVGRDPRDARAWLELAVLYRGTEDFDRARECVERALTIEPDNGRAWLECGILLKQAGLASEAATCYRRALQFDPDSTAARFNLANHARDHDQFAEARRLYEEVVSLEPENAEAWNNLGLCLQAMNDPETALQCFRQSAALQPHGAGTCQNIGNVLMELNLTDEAVAMYGRSLELKPDQPEAHHALALALLARGDYARGWEEAEWRLRCPATARLIGARDFPRPRWDGTLLDGKRLLVYAEQGLGDTIQFARFLPLAARQGGRILFACYPALISLCRSLHGIDSFADVTAPTLPGFEYYAPLMSLPHLLHLGPEDLAAPVPYLHSSALLPLSALDRLRPGGLKVGLSWATNTENRVGAARSIPLRMLQPLASIAGVRWFSLQLGQARGSGRNPDAAFPLVELLQDGDTMDTTAALIEKLDLVVTIDTSIAHLAGALARPVWTLLPFASDWRWFGETRTTRWYPTMQLFRQRRRGDWSAPVGEVAAMLQQMVSQ